MAQVATTISSLTMAHCTGCATTKRPLSLALTWDLTSRTRELHLARKRRRLITSQTALAVTCMLFVCTVSSATTSLTSVSLKRRSDQERTRPKWTLDRSSEGSLPTPPCITIGPRRLPLENKLKRLTHSVTKSTVFAKALTEHHPCASILLAPQLSILTRPPRRVNLCTLELLRNA